MAQTISVIGRRILRGIPKSIVARTEYSGGRFPTSSAASQFRVLLTFAGLMAIAAMGIATYLVFAGLERRLTRWATRRQETQFSGRIGRASGARGRAPR